MSLDIRPNPSVTGSVTGSLIYKGSYNATTNSPDLTSSQKGDFYIVSVTGTLAGVTLNVGDHIVFNQDASSPITSAMFDVIDNTDAVASVNGQTGVVSLDTDNITEGSSNLYYTNARFDTQLGTKTTDNISEGSSNLYYTNARFDTQLGTKTTDNISEGSSNLYYTNARADARIGAADLTDLNDVNYTAGAGIDGQFLKYVNANNRWEAAPAPGGVSTVNGDAGPDVTLNTDNIAEGSTNLYYTNARFDTQLGTKTTDNLTEGSSNLYYTNARFDTQLGTKTTDNVTEGSSNLYYTNARFDTQLGTKTTDNVSEGSSNLYFTNARADGRADSRIAASNLNALNDVAYTSGAGIDNFVLTYDHSSSSWGAEVVPSAPVSSVNTQTGAVVLNTDDVSEGSSNLYYTNARFDTQLGTKTTDNLTEGSSNLYYTNARFDTQLGTKDTGDLSEGSNLYYTNARADGRIGAANLTDLNDVNYTAGAGIDGQFLKYVNANNRWEAAPAPSGVSTVNGDAGPNVTLNTDNISEGSTNLYYTNARFDTQLGTKTTDNLTEGTSNLYYTNARFDTQLGTKDTGDISEGSNLYYTNARADARIGAANLTDLNDVNYTAGAGINGYVLTYNHSNTRWEAQEARIAPPNVTLASPSGAYSITTHAGNEEIYILTPSANITVNLPAASTCGSGYKYQIKNMSTSNTLTIDPNSTETIDGVGTFVISNQNESITVVTDGNNWFII